jgi:molecular chaperone GrpE
VSKKSNKTNPAENTEETAEVSEPSAVSEPSGENGETAVTEEEQSAPPGEENPWDALSAEKDKYLRLYAEFDNFKKRSRTEREALYTDIRAETILKLLPVYDNLTRALQTPCSDETYAKGIEMTATQFSDILKNLGAEEIAAVGEKFDANLHEGVHHVENSDVGEQIIVEEFQKGFILNGKVIRHATVVVAN